MAAGPDFDIWSQLDAAISLRDAEVASHGYDGNKGSEEGESSERSSPTCQHVDDHVSDGFLVCSSCGIVKDICIDGGAEWRCFNTNNGKDLSGVRCGAPASKLLPESALSTYIGGSKYKRQQRIHQCYSLTSKERNLYHIFKEFETLGTTFDLGKSVVTVTNELYSALYTEMENRNCGVKRCNVRTGLKAACLYYACKKLGCPRERKEIADMLDSTTKIVTRGCNTFLDIMGDEFIRMDPFTPRDFVARFCRLLGISYMDQVKIERIVDVVSTLESLADNTPTSVASGCIYFFTCEFSRKVSRSHIHDKCGSSQAIIAKICQKLVLCKEYILVQAGLVEATALPSSPPP